jgi:hypothetical protein
MADTYWGVYLVSTSPSLRSRVVACASKEDIPDPEGWVYARTWEYASAPTWAEKYEYALATGNEDPGKDAAVITDEDILTQVQKMNVEKSA